MLFIQSTNKTQFSFVTFHSFVIVGTYVGILSFSLSLQISVVTRDEVGAYKPYLWEQSVFVKGPMFRDWLLTKVSNEDIVLPLLITRNLEYQKRLNLCYSVFRVDRKW